MCILAAGQVTGEGTSSRSVELAESAAAPPIEEVEIALAKALLEAATARRFDVVERLARELETRRVARTRTSVQVDARRKGPV
jgi:hypothetical protein